MVRTTNPVIGGKDSLFIYSRTATAIDYQTLITDYIIGITNTDAVRTITLASVTVEEGRIVHIKDESGGAGTNNIIIVTEGAETIDGEASVIINADYNALSLYSDGTNWFIF